MSLPASWQTTTIGKIADVIPCFSFASKDWCEDGIPVMKIKNIVGDGTVNTEDADCVPEDLLTDRLGKFVLQDGDMLIAMTGATAGKTGKLRCSRELFVNQRVARLVPRRMHPGFFWGIISSAEYQELFFRLADGSAQPNMSGRQIEDVEIPEPPLPVQHKIASIFSAYDDLVENNTRRIAILEEMAQAIYREWFVDFRFPGHEKVKLVDSPLGKIPEGWEVTVVEKLVKRLQAGKKYNQKTVVSEGLVPVLDQGRSGIIGYHNDEPGLIATEDQPVIVFANHTCYQRVIHFPFSAIQNVLPFISHPDQHRNLYWLYWGTKDVISFNDYKGHWPEFMAKKIVFPPTKLCERFGEMAKDHALSTIRLARCNATLRTTRDLLLPKLISGQVDVADLDFDEGEGAGA